MSSMTLRVTNVGGIDETELTLDEGVTLVSGVNASNKTSLLKALLFALGNDEVPLKTGADRATVELTLDGKTVERTATRRGSGISTSGSPLVQDESDKTLFTRFGGLLETNPLRTAVQTGTSFEELLKEPMDIDSLERDRTNKLERKRSLQSRIEEIDGVEPELESVETELSQYRNELTELETELDKLYEQLPQQDDDLEALRQQRTELITEQDRLEAQIEDTESAVDRISSTIEEIEDELEEIEIPDTTSLHKRQEEINTDVAKIDQRIDILQSVLTANREMLDTDLRDLLTYEAGIDEETLECWACGRQAPVSSFESVVDHLATLIEAEKGRKEEYKPELEEIEEKIESAEEAKRRKRTLENRLQSKESKCESRRSSLEEKRDQLVEIQDEISGLTDELDKIKDERDDNQSEVSQKIEDTRATLEKRRRQVDRLEDKKSDLEERTAERERLKEELKTVEKSIHELTARIENLESDLRQSFNEAMDELIGVLEFDDIERLWLDGEFELVVARDVDGVVQEDSVDHLAESERSMIGLVLGLAGYLAYDVDTKAPVLVLDSLGAFDATRTERLIDYFSTHTDFLIAAVHPEQVSETADREAIVTSNQR